MTFYKWLNGVLQWSAGDKNSSSNLNNSIDQTAIPIGGIIPWAKNITGVPALREGFVECNGQTLSDADSPLNGQVIPDLNGDNRFLRANSTSGGTGGSETHTHPIAANQSDTDRTGADTPMYGFAASTSATDATSTLPSYYAVVMVMRVK